MTVDQGLVGREFPETPPHEVTGERVAAFAEAVGASYAGRGGPIPATYPIVLAFDAMNAFLAAEDIDLYRIVHGEQKFAYERPVREGDVLSARLTVVSVRQIGGADIIGTSSQISDAGGQLVCTTRATLVHSGGDA